MVGRHGMGIETIKVLEDCRGGLSFSFEFVGVYLKHNQTLCLIGKVINLIYLGLKTDFSALSIFALLPCTVYYYSNESPSQFSF